MYYIGGDDDDDGDNARYVRISSGKFELKH